MRQIRGQDNPDATDGECAAFDVGVESVMYIRCYRHRATPQLNKTEADYGECAQCAIEGNQGLIAEEVNDILLLLYDMSFANAPMPPGDCRDIAEKIAARAGSVRRLIGMAEGETGIRHSRVVERDGWQQIAREDMASKAGDDPELMQRLEKGLKEMNRALIKSGKYD